MIDDGRIDAEWVDYPTAERFTSLSHTTLWRYVRSGQVKSARVGRCVRIHLPSLRNFMEDRSYGDEVSRGSAETDSSQLPHNRGVTEGR